MRGEEQKKLHIKERLLQYNQDLMYGDIVWTIVPIVIMESSLPWDISLRCGRDGAKMTRQQIYDMPFGKVYDCLIAKAERKGRTRDEVDELAKGKAVEKIKRG